MDIIAIAKELGKAIQQEDAYKELVKATESNDANAALQEDIEHFNLLRLQLNEEVSKSESDQEKVERLQNELTQLYDKVTTEPGMVAFNDARTKLEQLLEKVNQVITAAANGEDMDTFEPHEHSCGGNCSSCGGCH